MSFCFSHAGVFAESVRLICRLVGRAGGDQPGLPGSRLRPSQDPAPESRVPLQPRRPSAGLFLPPRPRPQLGCAPPSVPRSASGHTRDGAGRLIGASGFSLSYRPQSHSPAGTSLRLQGHGSTPSCRGHLGRESHRVPRRLALPLLGLRSPSSWVRADPRSEHHGSCPLWI